MMREIWHGSIQQDNFGQVNKDFPMYHTRCNITRIPLDIARKLEFSRKILMQVDYVYTIINAIV